MKRTPAPEVVAFLRDLDHPMKKAIEAVRKMILGVSPEIRECIKWKSPTFRTTDDFATVFLRDQDRVRLIFHTGAKVKKRPTALAIEDPAGLIEWITKDRCFVTVGAPKDIPAKRKAFESIVRAWIRQL